MPEPHLSELLEVAVVVARQAADLALAHRLLGVADVGTKSTDTDLVTAADRAVEQLIRGLLGTYRPGETILGEELGTGTVADEAGPAAVGRVRWVVDPIDGTVNYVYGIPHYAVSVAAEVDGVSSVGVVRHAVTGQTWSAVRGQGAWRDGVRLRGSSCTDLSRALVATGFAYHTAGRARQARVVAGVLPLVRDIRRFGAASLDLCAAAEGRVDAYFETGLSAWDHAAGGLVAAEAGLRVGGLRGAPAGPDLVLAAPHPLYDQLHDLLDDLRPPSDPAMPDPAATLAGDSGH